MSAELQSRLEAIFISIGTTAGAASTLDNIEQIGRIALLAISILSGILLCVIHWNKAFSIIKKKLKW